VKNSKTNAATFYNILLCGYDAFLPVRMWACFLQSGDKCGQMHEQQREEEKSEIENPTIENHEFAWKRQGKFASEWKTLQLILKIKVFHI
jgi:hypothetical protein